MAKTSSPDLDEADDNAPAVLDPGFHVMLGFASLGCYETEADAEAFADAHPRAANLEVTIREVSGE